MLLLAGCSVTEGGGMSGVLALHPPSLPLSRIPPSLMLKLPPKDTPSSYMTAVRLDFSLSLTMCVFFKFFTPGGHVTPVITDHTWCGASFSTKTRFYHHRPTLQSSKHTCLVAEDSSTACIVRALMSDSHHHPSILHHLTITANATCFSSQAMLAKHICTWHTDNSV
jgi:hypothetical protein